MFLGAIVRPLPIIASGHCTNLCRLSYPIVAPTTRIWRVFISFTITPCPIIIPFPVTAPLNVNSAQHRNAQRQDEQLHCRSIWQKKNPFQLLLSNIYLLYFICHTIITKYKKSRKKKRWPGDLTDTIGAYERLGLLEVRARAV